MKTEHFDDAIRRKMESISPPASREDIDKVYGYVSRHRAKGSLWRRFGLISAFAALGGIIAVLIIFIYKQQNDHILLLNKINTLTAQVEAERSRRALKADTLYISTGTETGSAVQRENTRTIPEGNAIASSATQSGAYKGARNSPVLLAGNASAASGPAKLAPDKAFNEAGKSGHAKTPEILQGQKRTALDSSGNVPLVIDSARQAPAKNTVTRHFAERPASEEPSRNENPKHFISFNNLHYRAGTEFQMANEQFGGGLIGELFLTDKLTFSTGLRMLVIKDEKFSDNDEFHHRKGEDFQKAYSPYVSDTSVLANIDKKTTLVQLPVYIGYHLPLSNNFTLLFSLGADLDLMASESIHYEHRRNELSGRQDHFSNRVPALVVNNLVFQAGIEKQWNHFVLQGIPFISPQLTHVAYKKEDLYAGFSLRALWDFH